MKEVIFRINNAIEELKDNEILFKLDQSSCNDGSFQEYKRMIIKMKSACSYYEEKEKFRQLDLLFSETQTDAQRGRKYKNSPTFIDAEVLSASIKINTAHKSFRFDLSDVKEKRFSFASKFSLDSDELDKHTQFLKMYSCVIEEKTQGIIKPELHQTGASSCLIVSSKEIARYVLSLDQNARTMTARQQTGKRYQARFVTTSRVPNCDINLGVIILHTKTSIQRHDIARTARRQQNSRSLELTHKKLDLDIGVFEIFYR